MVALIFEHPDPEYANVKYVVYPDAADPWWFKVTTKTTGEDVWQRLKPTDPDHDINWKDVEEQGA